VFLPVLIESKSEILKTVIRQGTGAEVEVMPDESGLRNGLRVHFSGWTRQEGPVFGLKPSGLNRHIINFHFGDYAKPCVKHIVDSLTPERNAVAWALINRLRQLYEVKISPLDVYGNWQITQKLSIQVTIKGVESLHDDAVIERSASTVMVPLIGAIAELLGEDDSDIDLVGDEEGGIKEYTSLRRERSQRNRLLCLFIHGFKCKICNFDPISIYGTKGFKIIEVHHIDPLSESLNPRQYDPSVDLIPLCPNCHRAIHIQTPAFKPDQLKSLMKIK